MPSYLPDLLTSPTSDSGNRLRALDPMKRLHLDPPTLSETSNRVLQRRSTSPMLASLKHFLCPTWRVRRVEWKGDMTSEKKVPQLASKVASLESVQPTCSNLVSGIAVAYVSLNIPR